MARHRAGDLPGAMAEYREAVAADPGNGDALHLLGVALHLSGDSAGAVPLLRKAVARDRSDAELRCNLAAALSATGDLDGALQSCREAVALNPDFLDAHANMAAILVRRNDLDGAIASFAAAHRLRPDLPRFMKRLAELCLARDRLTDAADWYERYLAAVPADAGAHNNAAFALEQLGRLREAEIHYGRALTLRPDLPEIANNLANVVQRLGRHAEAAALFDRALAADPTKWEDQARRAGALCNRGRTKDAIAIYGSLVSSRSDDASLHLDYARALIVGGHFDAAEDVLRRTLALRPGMVEAQLWLGTALYNLDRKNEAISAFETAVEAAPGNVGAQLRLCAALVGSKRLEDACAVAATAVRLADFTPAMLTTPHQAFRAMCAFDEIEALDISIPALDRNSADTGALAAGFLECLVLADDVGRTTELAGLHRLWGAARMARAAADPLPPRTTAARSGPLRLGFVSSDLRQHSVARFVLPLIEHYDRAQFEIYCYSPDEMRDDPVQRRIREMVNGFRVFGGMPYRDVALAIRDDAIDILFELNGFTGHSRLAAMAYRPAPVQVYWLGYPFTTGLEAMDYILLDADLAPARDGWLAEKPLLLPGSWVCYDPSDPVPVSPVPPVERDGFVTFGTLNNPYKFTRPAVVLWARIMSSVPRSRFLLVRPECASARLRQNLTLEFGRHGIGADRLSFVDNRAVGMPHLAYYDRIDLSLDTMPLTGGTTTADALWMGVPVVTLVGPSLHQRISYAILCKAGLDDLAVGTADAYVECAVALARSPERLRAIRAEGRARLLESPFCRPAEFAKAFGDLMQDLAVRHGLR